MDILGHILIGASKNIEKDTQLAFIDPSSIDVSSKGLLSRLGREDRGWAMIRSSSARSRSTNVISSITIPETGASSILSHDFPKFREVLPREWNSAGDLLIFYSPQLAYKITLEFMPIYLPTQLLTDDLSKYVFLPTFMRRTPLTL